MTKTRKFHKEYWKELLAIATQDLETARLLIPTNLKRKENILFHIEQAIEKSLKAGLCKLEIAVPLVHELSLLVDKFPQGKEPPFAGSISDLSQFATIRRYEEGKANLTKEEIAEAYQIAEAILDWVEKV